MLPHPTRYALVAGTGDGATSLTAFDKALLNAGIGNVNLVKISSILPPGVCFTGSVDISPGSLVPTAYGYMTSDVPGERVAAAVAVGLSPSYGVIMEYAGKVSAKEAEQAVRQMVFEAFRARDIPLLGVLSKAAEHTVKTVGCAFAAVVLCN